MVHKYKWTHHAAKAEWENAFDRYCFANRGFSCLNNNIEHGLIFIAFRSMPFHWLK
jgi:hypothetical protein